MKSGYFSKWSVGLALSLITWVAPCQVVSNSPAPTATGASRADADVTSAAVPVQQEKPLPPQIRPSSPTAELIRLVNSGVAESVLLAYVTNSTSTFNLGAEEIIYLNDIGVPSTVVTAMIQHDQMLKTQAATAPWLAAPEPLPSPVPTPATNLVPIAVAPMPQSQSVPPPPAYPPPTVEAPLTPPAAEVSPDFYGSLAPYGTWVSIPDYGLCWQPSVVVANPGWQPYFNCGRWVYTDCGWYWMSDYTWGWAPFHYGRWFCHSQLGWCWMPGSVWGPSWVTWRYSDAYCGWAPLPPACVFTVQAGLCYGGRPVHDHDDCGVRPGHYRFVAWNDFHNHRLHDHALPRPQADHIFHQTVVATSIVNRKQGVMNQGIPPQRVAAATHTPINTVALQDRTGGRPVYGRSELLGAGGRTLGVYRPSPARPSSDRGLLAEVTNPGFPQTGRPGSSPGQSSLPTVPLRPPASTTPVGAGEQVHSGAHQAPQRDATGVGQVHSGAHVQPMPPGSYVTIGSQRGPQMLNSRPVQSPQPPAGAGSFGSTSKQPYGPAVPQPQPVPRYGQNPTPWQTATPTIQNPNAAPPGRAVVPQQPSGFNYQTPAQPVARDVPRYNSYVPQRTYTPAPSPQPDFSQARSAPSRPVAADVPRYSPPAPVAPAAPARPSGGDVRPAPPAPQPSPAPSSGNSGPPGRR